MKKTELIKALEAVRPGLANKEMIEQSTSFAFMQDRVVTYNDEISISYPIQDLDLTGAIKAEELYAFLSKAKTEDIEVEIDDAEIRLKAGRAKAGFTLQAEITLPLDEIGGTTKWKSVPDGLLEAIKFVSFGCSTDMSRPVLTCVHVTKSGNIEGGSNTRLTRYQTNPLPEHIPTFLLPATSAKQLVKYAATEMAWGKGWIHFKTKEGCVFSCRVIEEDYPDISAILAVEGTEFQFPKTIDDILDRAAIFALKGDSKDGDITVSLEKNKITLASKNVAGWVEDSANIRYKGELVSFFINPIFLKEIVPKTRQCVLGKASMRFESDLWEHVVALKQVV